MTSLSHALRSQAIDGLASMVAEVLVVGGGIVGAGVARDAAMRGLRVGLIEQYDFAYGTSSRTSRLLHGGIRYLAQGRIRLVYQASQEKRILHHIAPHVVEPLAMLFPAYRGGPWPLWKLRIGVKLYDWLCGQNLGPSEAWGRDETLRRIPGLEAQGLRGSVRYYDGLTNDARLVLDTLRSAAAHGAILANYVRLEEASPGRSNWRCQIRDLESDRGFTIQARCVVNAAGPWAPGLGPSRLRLRLTKGVHLVVDRDRLPVPDAVVLTDQDRIVFAIPWGQRVILGTTDTDYGGPIEAVATEPADVEYLLGIVNRFFPSVRLGPEDIRACWAGVRPLVGGARGGPSDISRAHRIRWAVPGWLDVAGGKLTTYRRMAQEAVDRLVRYLGVKSTSCRTATEPLLPSDQPHPPSAILPPEPNPRLVHHYCAHEWAVHLEDVMRRRTSWQYYVTNPEALAEQVAGWMAGALGWDPARQTAELERYRQQVG